MLKTETGAQHEAPYPKGVAIDAADADPNLLERVAAAGGDTARGLVWASAPTRPLDIGGPVDRPFERMGDDFSSIGASDHLKRIAAKFPDKLAISDGARQFTYGELLSAVDTLARLIAVAVPEGQAVGLLLGNSAWYPVAMLASMAAGRPSVPLNPRDPLARIAGIAADARLPALVGADTEGFAAWSKASSLTWIEVTRALSPAPPPAAALPLAPVSVDAPAVVLYTSGSTGRPKGIVNSQRSILQRVQQYTDACHINADDVFMPLSGPATIAGCREVMTALLCGATLHVADVETLGLRALRRQFRTRNVTIVYLVPALLRALMKAPLNDDFESLRIVRIGGERVLWTDTSLARKAVSASCFIQGSYSSTETTGSQWFVPPDFPEQGASVPMGFLLPGISFAIVDDDGNPVGPDMRGELLIKSMYVMLGHWEDGHIVAAETDAADPRCRVVATGDLVQLSDQGLLQIVGRKGRQIKINGRRVEPAELELVLRRTPHVGDAVAVVTETNELIVFAVPDGDAAPSFVSGLRDVIRTELPPSLQPTRLHSISEIPRLPGGKVDAAKLREVDRAMRETMQALHRFEASEPLNVEQMVENLWNKSLGTRTATGRWDEAGGDSLKLLQCILELEGLVGRELDLEAFTIAMTVGDMIAAVAPGPPSKPCSEQQGDLPPLLFLIPGSVGYGPSLAAFGAQMGKVVRVAPIRYPDLGAILEGRGTIAAMADAALDQITLAQPRGEIRLLGYSLGGAVAFDVATRLIAAGRPVKFIGVLDTSINGVTSHYREAIARTLQRIQAHRTTIYRMSCRAVAKCAARLGAERRFAAFLDHGWWRHLPHTHFMLRLELEEILRMRAFGRWLAAGKPKLAVTGTLFRCHREGSPDLGWNALFDHVDVVPIAGGHLDLVVEPHLTRNRPLIEAAIIASFS